jgi:hypothetical protein
MSKPLAGDQTAKYIAEALIWALTKSGMPPSASFINTIINHRERARIIGLALGYIMNKRKGNCSDKYLAYADHYLQSRVMVALLGPAADGLVSTLVVGYEIKKKIWEELGLLENMASDARCPSPVSPDMESVRWGLAGVQAGKADFYIDTAANVTELWKKIFG